jgi:hypothetical protein
MLDNIEPALIIFQGNISKQSKKVVSCAVTRISQRRNFPKNNVKYIRENQRTDHFSIFSEPASLLKIIAVLSQTTRLVLFGTKDFSFDFSFM